MISTSEAETGIFQIRRLRWYVCGLLFTATVLNYVDRQVFSILAPDLQREIGSSELGYGPIVIAFQVSYAVCLVLSGRVIDKIGTKLGYSIAVIWWSVAEMAHARARNPLGFGVARLFLGAGAATAYAILKTGAGHLTLVDQDASRSAALAARCNSIFGEGRACASDDIAASLAGADGLIHATPTGMFGHPGMALPASMLRASLWVAEIVYFPLETELLRAARAAGCRTLDGSGMAVHQAVEAFRLFSGLEPDATRMHRHFVAMGQPR